MEEPFLELLKRSGTFSKEEAFSLQNALQFKRLAKDGILLEKGTICSSLCFVISGSFYHHRLDNEGNKSVIDLNSTHDWVINHTSFTSRKPSAYVIQAFEDSTFYEISIDAIHRLIAQSQAFLQMGKILDTVTERINFFDNNSTPDEKYRYLLENKADLLQKFPQTIIASYLKISPETLSRVRKRLS